MIRYLFSVLTYEGKMPYNVVAQTNRLPGRFAFQTLPTFTTFACGQSAFHVSGLTSSAVRLSNGSSTWKAFCIMVNKCTGCKKPRSRWSDNRKNNPNACYCSDKCKAAYKAKTIFDGRTDRAVWNAVMKRDNYTCCYCGDKAEQVDHVVPYSKNGRSDMDNLVAACKWCNTKARDKLFESFSKKRDWLRAVQKLPPVTDLQIQKCKKLDWRAWVYGGMKSLKRT